MIDLNKLQKGFDDLFNDSNMPKDFENFIAKKRIMIENTMENKKKLMSLYIGQPVYSRDRYPGGENFKMYSFFRDDVEDTHVSLKPLSSSSITNEDAIEIAKIMTIQDTTGDDVIPFVKLCIKAYINKKCKGMDSNIADYLRSKGYALPYMSASVETMVKWGWIKLKED